LPVVKISPEWVMGPEQGRIATFRSQKGVKKHQFCTNYWNTREAGYNM